MARDSYSYLHYVMVAGIVLVALGLKKTLHDVDHDLGTVAAAALLGGAALYLLGHIAFRLRNVGTLNRQRLVAAAVIVALIPVGDAHAGARLARAPGRDPRRADRLRGDPLRRRAGTRPARAAGYVTVTGTRWTPLLA